MKRPIRAFAKGAAGGAVFVISVGAGPLVAHLIIGRECELFAFVAVAVSAVMMAGAINAITKQ